MTSDRRVTWMTNPHLMVHGERADRLLIENFTDADHMVSWETSIYSTDGLIVSCGPYEAYLKEYDTLDDITGLEDIFGPEFAERFYNHKQKLLNKMKLFSALKEREDLNKYIRHLRKSLK